MPHKGLPHHDDAEGEFCYGTWIPILFSKKSATAKCDTCDKVIRTTSEEGIEKLKNHAEM